MTSYYRRFIRDYAKVAKPLINLTRGKHAQVKASEKAHRNCKENKEQILERFYFPHMHASIKKYVDNCDIHNRCKYNRGLSRVPHQRTPDSRYPCEILHMDIMEIRWRKFITCLDKFAKLHKIINFKIC